jgi:allantoicase
MGPEHPGDLDSAAGGADDAPRGRLPGESLRLPDLASRSLRGSVIAASDEFFAEKENLIKPGPATHQPHTFGHKGQVYDGWETRRRRDPGGSLPGPDASDWVIVRLGAPGVVHAVVVDTAFFRGNFPQSCSVEACFVAGYPDAAALAGASWREIVPRSPLTGDAPHVFEVPRGRRYSHVRLRIFPDGGVARLRVHGRVVPDPSLLAGMTVDVAALENGGDVLACSDQFYSVPRNAISPGLSRVMGEGWETRRRRAGGHEWLKISLTQRAVVSVAEIDTSGYIGNAPGAVRLRGYDLRTATRADDSAWFEMLPLTPLLPDTVHKFRLPLVGETAGEHAGELAGERGQPVTSVWLDVFPDGGVARVRLHGSLTDDGLAEARRRWAATAPD